MPKYMLSSRRIAEIEQNLMQELVIEAQNGKEAAERAEHLHYEGELAWYHKGVSHAHATW